MTQDKINKLHGHLNDLYIKVQGITVSGPAGHMARQEVISELFATRKSLDAMGLTYSNVHMVAADGH